METLFIAIGSVIISLAIFALLALLALLVMTIYSEIKFKIDTGKWRRTEVFPIGYNPKCSKCGRKKEALKIAEEELALILDYEKSISRPKSFVFDFTIDDKQQTENFNKWLDYWTSVKFKE